MASSNAARSRLRRLTERLDRRRRLPPLVATVAVVLAAATVGRRLLRPLAVSRDSALFQHAGWYVLQRVTPYADFFHVRLPLIYAITTVLAALSGGNMAALHVLSVLVAVAAVGTGGVPAHVGVRQEEQVLDDERVEAGVRGGGHENGADRRCHSTVPAGREGSSRCGRTPDDEDGVSSSRRRLR